MGNGLPVEKLHLVKYTNKCRRMDFRMSEISRERERDVSEKRKRENREREREKKEREKKITLP